jgi:diguanylate cyclase (GGDEF)-like protein
MYGLEKMLEENLQLSTIGFAGLNKDGIIAYANSAFCEMFAYTSPNVAVGSSLMDHVSSRFYSSIVGLSQALNNPEATSVELRLERDGEALNLHIAGVSTGLRMLVVDRLMKASINSAFPYKILHCDALTGLGNRLMLENVISDWKPSEPNALSLALIMVDLDSFKRVNDTLGHGAGDTLLKLVAKRLKSVARTDDLVVRMGGDEFVILHTIGLQPIGAESVGKRIVELISRPFIVDGQQVNIGASVGIAVLNNGTNKTADLLKHADLALYDAKAAGRSTVKFFEPALAQRAIERRQLEVDLRRALGLKEFMLMYQPQVSMADCKLKGFEALIRWQNPKRGLVSPADFIPLAEETGEIHAIGEWVLRTACKEAMTWDGDFIVAVNVSPIQFESDQIIDIVRDALASSGLPAERLELEITEGVLMKDAESALKLLWTLKSLGVGIAMDDFGTGYSSLSYLNSFPFSKIKIDQSFVRMENSPKSRALIQAIISLGANLNMKTIAEGVETQAQFDELTAGGCMEAQGYLIGRPIPPEAVTDFIHDSKNQAIR